MSAPKTNKKGSTLSKSILSNFNINEANLMNSPNFNKVIMSSNIINSIRPIYLSNLSEESFISSKNICETSISMNDVTQMHKENTMNFMFNKNENEKLYQVGVVLNFEGVISELNVIYNFDYSWLSDDKNTEFTEWLVNKTKTSNSVCIISSCIKGWGKLKVLNAFKFLSNRLENLEKDYLTDLQVCSKSIEKKKQ